MAGVLGVSQHLPHAGAAPRAERAGRVDGDRWRVAVRVGVQAIADLGEPESTGEVELVDGPHHGCAYRVELQGALGLAEQDTLDRRPADYLYELLAVEPFAGWLANENRARNLATLSELLNLFQRYYHFSVVTRRNLASLRLSLFNSFLRLLHGGGINEYEDPDQPFPRGHVQVMTIHQAKGLEFPVVAVGSLAT